MNSLTFKFNMESFYFSTHLPIKAFSINGDELYSVGYDEISEHLLKNLDFNKFISLISLDKDVNSNIDMSTIDDINFTICPIINNSYNDGFYIIGPYSTDSNSSKAIYKPKHCINYLLNILYIKLEDEDNSSDNSTSYNLNVNKALKFIEENYKNQITLDQVCEKIGINKSYFCTIFKEHTNKTFSNYLSSYRINKSKDLLKNTDMPITEIAFIVGFNSVNYYNNNFKKLTNMTPAQYRNRI